MRETVSASVAASEYTCVAWHQEALRAAGAKNSVCIVVGRLGSKPPSRHDKDKLIACLALTLKHVGASVNADALLFMAIPSCMQMPCL